MKANIKISEVEYDDIVNLFSTALYGNSSFGCEYTREQRNKYKANEEDCYEDIIAKILLGGGEVKVIDCFAESEDDIYGNNPSVYWDDDYEHMVYPITLNDVINGLELAANNGQSERVMKVMNDDPSFDMIDADILMQFICYGDIIY